MLMVLSFMGSTKPMKPTLLVLLFTNSTIPQALTLLVRPSRMGYHTNMSVHEDLIELCTEMHRTGIKLTYESIRERRGGGSRRDISKALREWQRQRVVEATRIALRMPDDIASGADELVHQVWSAVIAQLQEALNDVNIETAVMIHDADQEVEQLHKIICEQMDEIESLRLDIEQMRGSERNAVLKNGI